MLKEGVSLLRKIVFPFELRALRMHSLPPQTKAREGKGQAGDRVVSESDKVTPAHGLQRRVEPALSPGAVCAAAPRSASSLTHQLAF